MVHIGIDSLSLFSFQAPCVNNVQSAIEHIYPLVFEFRKERSPEEIAAIQAAIIARGLKRKRHSSFSVKKEEDDDDVCIIEDDDIEEEFDSDQSYD